MSSPDVKEKQRRFPIGRRTTLLGATKPNKKKDPFSVDLKDINSKDGDSDLENLFNTFSELFQPGTPINSARSFNSEGINSVSYILFG